MSYEDANSKDVLRDTRGIRVHRPEIAYLLVATYCARSPETLCAGLGAADCHAQIGTEEGVWTCGATVKDVGEGPELCAELVLCRSDTQRSVSWIVPFRLIREGVRFGGETPCLCTSSCAESAGQ